VDDVAFIGALIDELSASYRMDRQRVYVTAFFRAHPKP
jgi:poly(3-hydroxybutyrate) depolymerase